MRSVKSLLFTTLFSVGCIVNAGPAETSVTTVVEGGQTLVETQIISLVGASGSTSTIALIEAANGVTLTGTLISSPTEVVFIQDINVPGEQEHEHLDCKIASNGVAQCVESLSASAGGSSMFTVVTFQSTFPVPTAAPTAAPAPSQTPKPGSPSGSASPSPAPNPSSSKPSSIAASASSSASSAVPSSPASSSPSAADPSSSPSSSATTPVAAPPSNSSSPATTPVTPPSTNSTDEPLVTVTSTDGSTPTNGTLTPPNSGAGVVGPNFFGAVAFMALISGMM